MTSSTAVLILGMHRSGTSCLTGSLQQHGLFLGEVFESNPHNLKGNRENAGVMQLNISLLEDNGGSWDNPPETIVWNSGHSDARDAIIAGFIADNHRLFGFKDPRTLLALDFWLEGLSASDCTVKFIGSFRHPLSVANSLYNRNNIPIEDGLELWGLYNSKLLAHYKKAAFPLVSFDVHNDEYQKSLLRISTGLGLPVNPGIAEKFFDDALRHCNSCTSTEAPEHLTHIYRELVGIYESQYQDYLCAEALSR
ncbi:MAG: hypothetical protein NTV43_15410 [Methylococcales bacterium]|nr:hypothetical protein [Methylococcales bacterium]